MSAALVAAPIAQLCADADLPDLHGSAVQNGGYTRGCNQLVGHVL